VSDYDAFAPVYDDWAGHMTEDLDFYVSLAAEAHGPNAGRLNARYSEIADLAGAGYIDAGAAVLDHGRWTATLPCLQGEPCTGDMVNLVRAPDGMRFCPTAGAAVQGVTGVCAGWSSGAYRFGTAMAAPVIDELRRQRV